MDRGRHSEVFDGETFEKFVGFGNMLHDHVVDAFEILFEGEGVVEVVVDFDVEILVVFLTGN